MLLKPVTIGGTPVAVTVAFQRAGVYHSLRVCSWLECFTIPPALTSWCDSSGYRDEALSGSELTAKLEPAFLSGLRCAQPLIRAKFFEVFDNSMKRRVYERLLYVTCSQNWEAMGNHFWIKQCIEVGWIQLSICDWEVAMGFLSSGQKLYAQVNQTLPTWTFCWFLGRNKDWRLSVHLKVFWQI